jgi:hypothetical protein
MKVTAEYFLAHNAEAPLQVVAASEVVKDTAKARAERSRILMNEQKVGS